MREVTTRLINDFKIYELGFDFMTYKVDKKSSLDFHHLIVGKKNCQVVGLGDGYQYENGCILNHDTSHPYLHLIECKDYQKFCYISSEMIDMKIKKRLDLYNLKRIQEILLEFEEENRYAKTKKGKLLIKPEFLRRVNL